MPPEEYTLTAGCKINLFLRITGRLENGYHTLESFFLPLPRPYDVLTITSAARGGLRFSCSDTSLGGADNLVVAAYEAYAQATGYAPDIAVSLCKNIPCGSGLGGGSSDAARFLVFLNDRARAEKAVHLDAKDLYALGARLGADIPFFFHNRPALARGIGDVLEPAPNPLGGFHLALVCPRIHINTAWAFTAWDAKNREKHDVEVLTKQEGEDSSPLVHGIRIQNDLAPVVFAQHPDLLKIVSALYTYNAVAASMSGSGASIFGIFSDKRDAENAVRVFQDAGERVFYHAM